MPYQIKQSSTEAALLFFLVSSSDHITGLTGATPTVTISKAGAAFASPSGTVSEIANGWYKVAANATDTGTLGPIALHATATSADPFDGIIAEVVGYDPQDGVRGGLTALPNATAGASGGLPTVDGSNGVKISVGTGTGQVNLASGIAPANMTQILGTAVSTPATAGILDVNVKNIVNAAAAIDTNNLLKVDVVDIAGAAVSTTTAQLGVNAVQIGAAVPGSATIGTVTNLTNAPTAGDLTATMKASVTAAVPSTAAIAAALPTDTTIQTDCYNALNTAFTDATSLNTGGLLDRIKKLGWVIRNELQITDANGNAVLYEDDSATQAASVSGLLTDNSTVTTRLKII